MLSIKHIVLRLGVVTLAINILSGCASTLKLDPVASEDQQEVFQEGTEMVISSKSSVVAMRPSTNTYTSTLRPTLVVSVFNHTDEPHVFSTENIEVFVNGDPVKVFTYDELVAEIKQQQASAALVAALNGAAQSMNAANAGKTYHSGSYNSSYYGNSGYTGTGYGSYSGYSYDPAASMQAQAAVNLQTQANMKNIEAQTANSLNNLSATMLKKTTVFPQNIYGGYITLDKLPTPDEVNVVIAKITFAGEVHEFKLEHIKVKN
jgi:hypothetical protein